LNENPITPQKKILVVEDDFYIRDLYKLQGQLMNYEVFTAADGEEGIEKIKSHRPDIILLDLMMPKVDGMTVLRTIRSDPAFANMKFIITTNMEDSITESAAKQLGVLEYVLKINNTPQAIMELVKKHIG